MMAVTDMDARSDHFRDMMSRPVMANNSARRVGGERHSMMPSSRSSESGVGHSKSLKIARMRVLLAPEMNPYVLPLHKVQTWESLIHMLKKLFGEHTINQSLRITDSQGNLILADVWEDLTEPGMTIVVDTRPYGGESPPPSFVSHETETYASRNAAVERQSHSHSHSRSSSRSMDVAPLSRPSSRSNSRQRSHAPQLPQIGERINILSMQPETFGQWAYGSPLETPQQKPTQEVRRVPAPAPPPLPPIPHSQSRPSSRQSMHMHSMRRLSPPQIPTRDPSRELEDLPEWPSSRSGEGIREIHVNPNVEDPPPRPESEARPKSRGNRITRINSKSTANLRLSKSSIQLTVPPKSPDLMKSFTEAPRAPPTPPSPVSGYEGNAYATAIQPAPAPPPEPPLKVEAPVPAPLPTKKTNRFTAHIHNFLSKHKSSSKASSRTPSPTLPVEGSLLHKYPPIEGPNNSALSTRRGKHAPPAIMVPPPPPIATVEQPIQPVDPAPIAPLAPRKSKSTPSLLPPPLESDDRSRVGYGHQKSPSLPPLPHLPAALSTGTKAIFEAREARAALEAREKQNRQSSARLLLQIKTHQEGNFPSPDPHQSATSSAHTKSSSLSGSIETTSTTPPTTPNMAKSCAPSPLQGEVEAYKEKKLPKPPAAFSAFPPREMPRGYIPADLPPQVQMQMRRAQTLGRVPENRPAGKLGYLGGGGGRTVAVGMF